MSDDNITIPSRLDCIDDARRWVTERVRAAGVDGDPVGEIELALTEALANVIEHGYGGASTNEIVVSVETDEQRLVVRIRDWGRPFEAETYAGRDLDDPGEGGYGVYLIRELMDDVTREPQPDGGTLLTLIKRREEGHDG
ncbi:MAG: putative anti-sigma regulatory factor, serine/threonine protein kinase [Solirubrobacteraceae bacterium]|nr:putative anti-sigma regulatory factor, serine/threonine protein kinase [Solirubrobacteraceae bacterium]